MYQRLERSTAPNHQNDHGETIVLHQSFSKHPRPSPILSSLRCDKKSVCFDRRVKVYRIPLHKSFPQEVRAALWYSREESKEIKLGCLETVRRMACPDFQESEDFCARGLEAGMKDALIQRRNLRWEALQQVLEEQCLQYESPYCVGNDERLRQRLEHLSAHAHYRGILDAQESDDFSWEL